MLTEVEIRQRIRDREMGSFRVSQPTRNNKFRTNEDRIAQYRPKTDTAGLSRNEKRRLRNMKVSDPSLGVKGSRPQSAAELDREMPVLTRTPLYPKTTPGPEASNRRSKPPSPRPLSFTPSSVQQLPIRLEAQVLEKLSGTLRSSDDGKKILGIDFPLRLPTARLELMNLNNVLDSLMESIRMALSRFETCSSTLIDSRKHQQEREAENDLLAASLQRGAGVEIDEQVSLQLAFDTVLADLIRQSLRKTRRVQAYYQQHVKRVEENCELQLAQMRETLSDFKLQFDALKVKYNSLQFQSQISAVQRLRQGNESLSKIAEEGQHADEGGNIAEVIAICLEADPTTSRWARLAKSVAEQLHSERNESLKVIGQLSHIIQQQEKAIAQTHRTGF